MSDSGASGGLGDGQGVDPRVPSAPAVSLGRYVVSDAADVVVARRGAAAAAEELGFDPTAVHEVALAVSELAANLVKYAGGGEILLRGLRSGDRVGLQVESRDSGPGIAHVDLAVRDGYSTGGSLGAGLGAVNRLMDYLEISTAMTMGTVIVATKWVRQHPAPLFKCPLDVGVATVPKQGETQNGDSYVIKHWSCQTLVGVIDGLGHGEPAARAACAARQYVQAHFDQPLEAIFRGAGVACRATRGVVMALAVIDWERERISFASIGNIEARAIDYPGRFNVMVRRGIVGLNAPPARVSELPWPVTAMLILHSDGISTHWRWEDVAHLANQPAAPLARDLLAALARPQDDSTILVVRGSSPGRAGS